MHILHLIGEFFERIRLDLGGATQLVLVAQQMSHLRVRHLPGKASGLLQNDAAILCVSVIPEIGTLGEETLAVRVDPDAEWIAAQKSVVEGKSVAIRVDIG